MNILVSGGAKNGKSMFAQKTARQMAEEAAKEMTEERSLPLYYIATMIPHDAEDEARIARHRREREGWGFRTIECGMGLGKLLADSAGDSGAAAGGTIGTATCSDSSVAACGVSGSAAGGTIHLGGVFLLDSVTALLSNEMFASDGTADPDAPERVARDCVAFAQRTGNTIFVSDYIYGDGVGYDKLTEDYRHGLAMIDRALARVCDRVVEVSAGIVTDWK